MCNIEDATKNEKVKVEPATSQYVQDDEVIIYCDSEYQMTNSSKPFVVRICLNNRTWSGIDPRCEKSELFTYITSIHLHGFKTL